MALRPFYNPFFSSGFDDFFEPPRSSSRDNTFGALMMPVLPNFERDENSILTRSSPGYEIHEDDKTYSIAIDVPGCDADDIKIDLEDDGRVLHLSGGRKVKTANGFSETKFVKRFTIGDNVETDKLSANLHNGVLEVTGPKKVVEEKKPTRIQITQGPPSKQPRLETEKKEAPKKK
jgi:HSP20 family protein